jgi:hypothetical protein
MRHAPLSARQLARCAQIRDVQLLRDVIRIGDQLVLIVTAIAVCAVNLFLVLGGLARALVGLLLLELSAFRACELGFPCGFSSLIFFIFLLIFLIFLLFFVFVRIIFIVVFLDVTTRARKD